MISEGEILKDAKMTFHAISRHSFEINFLCTFFMDINSIVRRATKEGACKSK